MISRKPRRSDCRTAVRIQPPDQTTTRPDCETTVAVSLSLSLSVSFVENPDPPTTSSTIIQHSMTPSSEPQPARTVP
ncbi:hypothetical protein C446_13364 [Halobiforma nitratireducens JCM 10879]|uniref:Uncharacterized protein n=1 Tax=Halobiforma nitratireducens JCM 10879 TaxID=1227454 RepID=M0LNL8_9EURY|nr:hypothetical protein C446_13364 [Halobiforma nitratireducens JCM 10879]